MTSLRSARMQSGRPGRGVIVLIIMVALVGCGSSSRSHTSSATASTAATTAEAKASACAQVMSAYRSISADAGKLGPNSSDATLQGQMIADADSMKAALVRLRSMLPSPSEQATLDGLSTAMGQLQQATRDLANNDPSANAGLAAASAELTRLNPQLATICGAP